MKPLNVALLGCGTVGSGVAELMLHQGQRLSLRAGRELLLRRIVVRDLDRARSVEAPRSLFTTDVQSVLDDPEIDVVAELVGGVEWPRRIVLDAFAAGKDVVTANKALLAAHADEIFSQAKEQGRTIAFEASVAGGIPIVASLTQNLTANRITAILGILNGTCNFILTGMSDQGRGYDETLKDAQEQGFAEADPTMDVDGTDAAQKLAILARIAFGVAVPAERIPRIGIEQVQQTDIRYARELGYTIKLLAEAWLEENELALHVTPVMLRNQEPLAQVRGPYNAIEVIGDAVGDTLFYGQGAGRMPTASAVVGDLIDLAAGRAQRTFDIMSNWSGISDGIVLREPRSVPSRFCLRLLVDDRPGVMAEIANALAKHQISISSIIQHEPLNDADGIVPLIIMTHTTPTGVFQDAMSEIEELDCVTGRCVHYFVAD